MLDHYAEDIGISKEFASRMGTLLGSGLNLASTCGAVTSAYLLLGIKYGEDSNLTKEKMREFNEKFLEENDSLNCEELLGKNITLPGNREELVKSGKKDKICPKAILNSIEILKKII